MPYGTRNTGKGDKPVKIVNKKTGKTVGSSKSEANAQKSINARNAAAHGWKPTKKG